LVVTLTSQPSLASNKLYILIFGGAKAPPYIYQHEKTIYFCSVITQF